MPLASIAAKAAAITPGAAAGAATITAIPTIGPWDTASRLPNGKRHGWLINGQSGTITAVVNALAKAGIELGENGSIYPKPKGTGR